MQPLQKRNNARMQSLEEKLRSCENKSRKFTVELQHAARQAEQENALLREMLTKHQFVELPHNRAKNTKELRTKVDLSLSSSAPSPAITLPPLQAVNFESIPSIKAPLESPSRASTSTSSTCDANLRTCGSQSSHEKPGTLTQCQTAITIINSVVPASEEYEIRQAIGCNAECCADLKKCYVENTSLFTLLDSSI